MGCQFQTNESEFLNYNPSSEFIEQTKKEIDDIKTMEQLQIYLEEIFEQDQKYRYAENGILDKYGHDSEEYRMIWVTIHKTDTENLIKIEYIFDKFGYPKKSEVGNIASGAPWFVIHHSSEYSTRVKHFDIIFKAYKDGNIDEDEMDFYLGRMYHIKFGSYFMMPSPYRMDNKIDTLMQILELNAG